MLPKPFNFKVCFDDGKTVFNNYACCFTENGAMIFADVDGCRTEIGRVTMREVKNHLESGFWKIVEK